MGYIVEIDAYDKSKKARKRTALGRFAHESAAFSKPVAGQPLAVYMGDDARNEYIYKFVGANWDAADANPADRMAAGDKYLTPASCTWRSSTPTAPASGSSCRSPTRPSPAMPPTRLPTRPT
jgi:hypothetical protein